MYLRALTGPVEGLREFQANLQRFGDRYRWPPLGAPPLASRSEPAIRSIEQHVHTPRSAVQTNLTCAINAATWTYRC